jgi:hypothetical protein
MSVQTGHQTYLGPAGRLPRGVQGAGSRLVSEASIRLWSQPLHPLSVGLEVSEEYPDS